MLTVNALKSVMRDSHNLSQPNLCKMKNNCRKWPFGNFGFHTFATIFHLGDLLVRITFKEFTVLDICVSIVVNYIACSYIYNIQTSSVPSQTNLLLHRKFRWGIGKSYRVNMLLLLSQYTPFIVAMQKPRTSIASYALKFLTYLGRTDNIHAMFLSSTI